MVRAELRLNQVALAKKTRLPAWVLSRLEHGHFLPTESQLRSISKALGVEPSDLYSSAAIDLIRESDMAA